MMRFASLVMCLGLAACGGKSSAKPQEPAAATGSAAGSDDGDNRGIGQAEVAQQACYEGCLNDGAKGVADWANKSDADKQAACSTECKDAGAGLPSDQPTK